MGRYLASLVVALLGASDAFATSPIDLSNLPQYLQNVSASVFPALKPIGVNVWNHPELGRSEIFAHDQVVNYFSSPAQRGKWAVTPHAFEQATAWSLVFENRPDTVSKDAKLPTIGFMSEMDALPAIGHACGHNLILLHGLVASALTRQALIDFKIPARIVSLGTPDEEGCGGKPQMLKAGAFNGGDVWLMAHPTITNAVQPMQARHNALLKITGHTHQEAVHKAFDQLVLVIDINKNLTALGVGQQSSLTPVEDVGPFTENVVQTQIQLGIIGSTTIVHQTITEIKVEETAFAAVNFTVTQDKIGNVVTYVGPGGHASEGTQGPLDFAIETFRRLRDSSITPPFAFYMPGNTSVRELDVTVSARTRYTMDLPALEKTLESQTSTIPDSITWDLPYKALEPGPYLGNRLIEIMQQPELDEVWVNSTIAPAASDAGWVQDPILDPVTHVLLSEAFPVFQANYGICPDPSGAGCPFNHEPPFKDLSATDLAYSATEKMARATAQIAIELAADPERMAQARSLVKQK